MLCIPGFREAKPEVNTVTWATPRTTSQGSGLSSASVVCTCVCVSICMCVSLPIYVCVCVCVFSHSSVGPCQVEDREGEEED